MSCAFYALKYSQFLYMLKARKHACLEFSNVIAWYETEMEFQIIMIWMRVPRFCWANDRLDSYIFLNFFKTTKQKHTESLRYL